MSSISAVKDTLFSCENPMCIFASDSEKDFTCHLEKEHGNSEVPCSYCEKLFPASSTLTSHIIERHGFRAHKCGHCEFKAVTETHVKLHLHQQHLTKKPIVLKCRTLQCGPLPNPEVQMLPPIPQKTKPFICGQGKCEFKTPFPSEFENHIMVAHKGISVFQCRYCKAEMIQPSRFISHQSFHEFFSFYCYHCNYGSNSDHIVKIHVATKHPDLPIILISRSVVVQKKNSETPAKNETKRSPTIEAPKPTKLSIPTKAMLKAPNGSCLKEFECLKMNSLGPVLQNPAASFNMTNNSLSSNAENLPLTNSTCTTVALNPSSTSKSEEAGGRSLKSAVLSSECKSADGFLGRKSRESSPEKGSKASDKSNSSGLLDINAEPQVEEISEAMSPLVLVESPTNVGSPAELENDSELSGCRTDAAAPAVDADVGSKDAQDGLDKLSIIDICSIPSHAFTAEKEPESPAAVNSDTSGLCDMGTIMNLQVIEDGHSNVLQPSEKAHDTDVTDGSTSLSISLKDSSIKVKKIVVKTEGLVGTPQCDESKNDDDVCSNLSSPIKLQFPLNTSTELPEISVSSVIKELNDATRTVGGCDSIKMEIDTANLGRDGKINSDSVTEEDAECPADNASVCTEILDAQEAENGEASDGSKNGDEKCVKRVKANDTPEEAGAGEDSVDPSFDSINLADFLLEDLREAKQNRLRRAPSSVSRLYNEELCTLARGSTFNGKCIQCEMTFFERKFLLDHVENVHSKNCIYMCNRCDYTTENMFTLQKHFKAAHPKSTRVTFVLPTDSVQSRNVHVVSENYMCSKCSKVFANLKTFKKHFKQAHPDTCVVRCGYCQQDSFKEGFMKHLSVNHPKKRPYFIHNCVKVPANANNIPTDLDRSESSAPGARTAPEEIAAKPKSVKQVWSSNKPRASTGSPRVEVSHDEAGAKANIAQRNIASAIKFNLGVGKAKKSLPIRPSAQLSPRFKEGEGGRILLSPTKRPIQWKSLLQAQKSLNVIGERHMKPNANLHHDLNPSPNEEGGKLDPREKSKYICPFCEHKSKGPSSLRLHLRCELDYKPFRCRLCKARSTRSCTMKNHLKVSHSTEDETKYRTAWDSVTEAWMEGYITFVKCTVEPAITVVRKEFDGAVDQDGEQCLCCPYCDFHTSGQQRTNNIIRHIRGHLRYYPFVCRYCKKAFTDYSTTAGHVTAKHLEKDVAYDIASISAIDAWIDNMVRTQLTKHSPSKRNAACTNAEGASSDSSDLKTKQNKTVVQQNMMLAAMLEEGSASAVKRRGDSSTNILVPYVDEFRKREACRGGGNPQEPLAKKRKIAHSGATKSASLPVGIASLNDTELISSDEIPDFLSQPVDMNALVEEVLSRTMKEIEAQPFHSYTGRRKPKSGSIVRRLSQGKNQAAAQKSPPPLNNAVRTKNASSPRSGANTAWPENAARMRDLSQNFPALDMVSRTSPASANFQGFNQDGSGPSYWDPVPLPFDQHPHSPVLSGMFKCAYCNYGPGVLATLRVHWEQYHKELMFKVKRLASSVANMQSESQNLSALKCSYCPETFPSLSLLRVHCKQRHPGCAVKFVKCRRDQAGSGNDDSSRTSTMDSTHFPYSFYGKTPKPIDKNKIFIRASIDGISEKIKVPLSIVSKSTNFNPKVVLMDFRCGRFC